MILAYAIVSQDAYANYLAVISSTLEAHPRRKTVLQMLLLLLAPSPGCQNHTLRLRECTGVRKGGKR